MPVDTINNSLYQYLSKRGINLNSQLVIKENINWKDISEDEVKEQLDLICLFHRCTENLDTYGMKSIENKIGKTIEEMKIQVRRLKKQLKNIELKSPNNEFEELLLKRGPEFSARAQKSLDRALDSNYMMLLRRSMKKNEVCIGDSSFSNLGFKDSLLVKDAAGIGFNLWEMDCLYLLSKLKRKGAVINWDELIAYYCRVESLGEDSEKFILALLSFPYEFIKCCTRYRENKKDWSIEKYKESLEKAISKDGQSLV